LVTRVLRKSGAQDLSGGVSAAGDGYVLELGHLERG